MVNSIQRQTAREMKEGARNSKRIAREAAARDRRDRKAAKKANLDLDEYRRRRRSKDWDREPEWAPLPSVDTTVKYPRQVRRQIAYANALLDPINHQQDLKWLRLSRILKEAAELVEDMFP